MKKWKVFWSGIGLIGEKYDGFNRWRRRRTAETPSTIIRPRARHPKRFVEAGRATWPTRAGTVKSSTIAWPTARSQPALVPETFSLTKRRNVVKCHMTWTAPAYWTAVSANTNRPYRYDFLRQKFGRKYYKNVRLNTQHFQMFRIIH